jgi:S-DNA-T family DNA segregation ATPase FtsK/SpoIIIE
MNFIFIAETNIKEFLDKFMNIGLSIFNWLKTLLFSLNNNSEVKTKDSSFVAKDKKAVNIIPNLFFKKNIDKKKQSESTEYNLSIFKESSEDKVKNHSEQLGSFDRKEVQDKSINKRRVVTAKVNIPAQIANWQMPKLNLLEDPPLTRVKVDKEELKKKAEQLTEKLRLFDIEGAVVAVKSGPAVTMLEFKPNADVKLSHITSLENDLAIALSSESLRIIAPIPGRDVVGIESSNSVRETVYLKDLIAEESFWKDDIKLPIALGKQTNGDPQIVDLRKMPHLLVAGSTGSGKSVFTVSLITGLIFKHSPKTLKLIMVDPKQVDLAAFSKLPHLLMPTVVDTTKAVSALRWAVKEMDKRYRSMSKFGARSLEDYNEAIKNLESTEITEHEKVNQTHELNNKKNLNYYYNELPYIVIVVEEFGDLMQIDSVNVEQSVVRLAQLARACGIHLILCMQSPRKEIVTGLIKTNIPGRISFKVASKMDSRIILDESGAERLLARGDMLFRAPGTDKPMRHHGPWASDPDIAKVAEFWSDQSEPAFDPKILQLFEDRSSDDGDITSSSNEDDNIVDEKYDEILEYVSGQKEMSASLLQRKYRLGYPRAARLIEIMEKEKVVGPPNGSKPRQVLIQSFPK